MTAWLAWLACAPLAAAAPSGEAAGARGVILVSVDALRADRVGARRGGEALTPALDRLAARGALFSHAIAQAPWTLPSMATVFTALPPHRHGLTNRFNGAEAGAGVPSRLPPRLRTLAEAFRDAGFDTAAFTGDAGLDRAYGFDRGFDVFFDSVPFAGFETTLAPALAWLRSRGGRPFFLFVHGYDVHGQHAAPPPEGRFLERPYEGPYTGAPGEFRELRAAFLDGALPELDEDDRGFWMARYDEQVSRADARLGRFLEEALALPGLSTGALVAVMSDHGEELFDHGGLDHGLTLYDEAIRVPLLLAGPGVARRRVSEQVRLMDLAPTLLELAGVRDEAFARQAAGVSLRPLLEGRALELDALSETDFLFRASKRALRAADGRKLIFDLETLRREGYDLRRDPGERRDLAGEDPAWAAPLERRLRAALGLPPGR